MKAILTASDYALAVHLGCTEEERASPQEVRISFLLYFALPPQACESDLLQDTVCYAKLCEQIREVCTSRSFRTVEHLAREITSRLKATLPPQLRLDLQIHKVHAPVEGLLGGVRFELREAT